MRTGSLSSPIPARRQRILIEMIRLELALQRLEKETGRTNPSVGRNLNE